MRCILQISLPVEKFNQALRDSTADKTIARILEETKPEAAYFTAQDGKRGGILIIDLSCRLRGTSALSAEPVVPELQRHRRNPARDDPAGFEKSRARPDREKMESDI